MNSSMALRFAHVFLMNAVVLVCLGSTFSFTEAQQSFDITSCHSGVVKVLFADKEVTLKSGEGWGIMMSNQENKVFDNVTFHVITTIRTIGKDISEVGYVKFMDPDGDVFLAELSMVGAEHTNKFFYGTGKWKGITGSSKGQRIVFRMMPPDWAAACSRTVGTFELPKK